MILLLGLLRNFLLAKRNEASVFKTDNGYFLKLFSLHNNLPDFKKYFLEYTDDNTFYIFSFSSIFIYKGYILSFFYIYVVANTSFNLFISFFSDFKVDYNF